MVLDFFSSDHHFFHERVCGLAKRPFTELSEMHERLIEDHNAVVQNGDRWWCLGDFSFGDSAKSTQILKRMNGQKFLVLGNHDHSHRMADGWQQVVLYKDMNLLSGGEKHMLVLSHFPFLSWHRMHYGAYHLHGHSHGGLRYPPPLDTARILDVGVDNLFKLRGDYKPLELFDVRTLLADRVASSVDHHKVKA